MQRVLVILVVALVLFWIIDAPSGAANTVTTVLGALGDAAHQVTVFFQRLF